MADQPRILGICGAPCTGKTTLAGWLTAELSGRGLMCELLPELARLLAAQGVRIDGEMRDADYDAFLAAYFKRDGTARATLAIADRTPVDHLSYLAVNRNAAPELLSRHREAALAAMHRYRLVLYLPVQFPPRDDNFRATSPDYQHQLDEAIRALLPQVTPPVITVRGDIEETRRQALAAIGEAWPDLPEKVMQAGGG
jgi:nicotinamide riboside kinase